MPLSRPTKRTLTSAVLLRSSVAIAFSMSLLRLLHQKPNNPFPLFYLQPDFPLVSPSRVVKGKRYGPSTFNPGITTLPYIGSQPLSPWIKAPGASLCVGVRWCGCPSARTEAVGRSEIPFGQSSRKVLTALTSQTYDVFRSGPRWATHQKSDTVDRLCRGCHHRPINYINNLY